MSIWLLLLGLPLLTLICVCLHVYTILNEFLVIIYTEGGLGYKDIASKQDLSFFGATLEVLNLLPLCFGINSKLFN